LQEGGGSRRCIQGLKEPGIEGGDPFHARYRI
jgi:hypothetical protein